LLANDPDWAPRPIPQSYSAYTPALARKNADHLLGPSAPANIFFSIEPIDGRLPALDDGPSWPILLSRYDVAGLRGGMAILRRTSPAPSPIAEDRLQEGIFQLGQSIALPTDAPWIWARPDVEPTWLGRIASFVYKPPPLRIAFQFADGHASDFRYIAAIGRAGFLAAPLVVTTRDFVALGLPPDEVSGARPIAMTIFAPAAGQWLDRWFWRSSFSAAFSAIRLPAQPAIARILCPDDAVTPADCPARRDSDTRAAASPAGHARPNPESARR
jgi:hypothetical protein